MMQQTDRCLLYFGGSLTHLKRSAERGADGPEACPFPSRLTPSVLQNGVSCYPSVPPPTCMRGFQRAGVLRPLSYTSRLSAGLERVGVKVALNRHAPSLKAWRAAHVPPPSLSVCLQNMRAAVAAGEAAVAAATEVRRERRPRIRRRSNAPAVELLAPGNRLNWFPPAAPAWSQHARTHAHTHIRAHARTSREPAHNKRWGDFPDSALVASGL